VDIANCRVHDRDDVLTVLIRMIQSERMTEFMNGDTAKIDNGWIERSSIRIPGKSGVEDRIGLFENIAPVREEGDREYALTKLVADNGGGKEDRNLVIIPGGDDWRKKIPIEMQVSEVRIPDIQRSEGRFIERGGAVR